MRTYVSFIVAARNDDYGGNFLKRLQMFTDVLLFQTAKWHLQAECIVVEWNPPPDRCRLREALQWNPGPRTMAVRFIEVPEAAHRRLPNAERLPMFDCFAKNVGIRRAEGDYVLVTNPDILLSDDLVAYLACRPLSKDRLYRIDRYDFRGPIPSAASPQEILWHATRNIYQVNIRGNNQTGLSIPISWPHKWFALLSGKWPGSYYNSEGRQNSTDVAVSLNNDNGLYGGVYTNASGDFLLAGAECWRAIRGFPEFTDTFTHLDSYGCHQLKALGLEQTLLRPPCMILHCDHSRSEQKTRPVAPYQKWQEDLNQIRKGILGPAINGHNWGLANEMLPETIV